MNAVALQNTRCIDPVYHTILSWREEDTPTDMQIFDSARYCLSQLGMAENQYVFAIHRDTDNVHCHIAVNRVHPISYRAANLYNDVDRLHKACRYLELKYGFTPDNGAWRINELQQVVRTQNDFKSIPRKAKQLEYYADKESLFSYAVGECRHPVGDILAGPEPSWEKLHTEFIRAGLDLRLKGDGLAVYSREDDTLSPIKASALHPDLTLYCLEGELGKFEPSPEVVMLTDDNNSVIFENYHRQYVYDPRLHARDSSARIERRMARAEAREDLKSRYAAYKSAWVKPKQNGTPAKLRYQNLSKQFAWQKARVRITMSDPLMRKLTYHIIDVERMKAMASLRQTLKAERDAFRADPANRRLTYRAWVEQQALQHDQAAIAQLRGWAYRLKRQDRTAALSENGFRCAVADDCRPFTVDGYETRITRDGVIQYLQNGRVEVQDSGERIDIARPGIADGQHIMGAMVIAEEKSGEHLVLAGDSTFVRQACGMVKWFNEGGERPLPLTDSQQRRMAGYEQAESAAETVPALRAPETETERKSEVKPVRNTFRPH